MAEDLGGCVLTTDRRLQQRKVELRGDDVRWSQLSPSGPPGRNSLQSELELQPPLISDRYHFHPVWPHKK
ncbi:unnamed protein product [Nezara viridula]|uniref:Uncharacterized protein n=1 Tax=Nezara viridula TaxID=85310 RepID=A0A9P0H745_NEZVI|nr:unnamed protein product [Nezara viridula]